MGNRETLKGENGDNNKKTIEMGEEDFKGGVVENNINKKDIREHFERRKVTTKLRMRNMD